MGSVGAWCRRARRSASADCERQRERSSGRRSRPSAREGGGEGAHRVALQGDEEPDALEPHERALGRESGCALVHLERLSRAAQLFENGADAADEGRVGRVDLERAPEVVVGERVLARLEVDVAEAEPVVGESVLLVSLLLDVKTQRRSDRETMLPRTKRCSGAGRAGPPRGRSRARAPTPRA